ncbi:MAG: eukaryotic-like serine/threonine-protein kinase [Verrucomicrobiota bacterium]|jgi:tetratricopeptide (TPR) repeat protein
MSSAPLERLKEIFHSARELLRGEREAFLTGACGGDVQLRREIDALLESDRAADDFIADPPARLVADAFGGDSPIPSEAGRMIGQYKLIKCIGTGGMGAVYLAERADQQFQMQVAIKLIKRGMDTDSVLRRFQHERQILASLEHPNIARLLDGGTTDDGLPYFVMEYIKGERIDHYAEQQHLSMTARLDLFRQVCGAVSYAHQNLVVHRDLKPSNILVTSEGVPKLLDFGIAKIIQAGAGTETLATITAMPAMTPEYASPEQIEGTHATTLSDVYSLGAVLYELLSGRPPYRLQNRSSQEIAKAITTTQLEKPSARVSRSEDARLLRGDLDNIVLMAMRRDAARRYRSVEQFSEDIRRHLTGRPVIARADTLSYRAGKFWRRNKLGIAAAVLLLLTLIGGIVATARQARRARVQEKRARAEQARAERRFNDVRKLANSVLFDYHDAIRDLPGSTKVRERLVKDAVNYLDSLASEANDDPALQRELAAAYERVGDVRGGAQGGGSLGDPAGAIESYTKALRIREALAAVKPGDAQARRDLARSHRILGYRLPASDDANNDLSHLERALRLYVDLTREQPANDELQFDLADTHHDLGAALNMHNNVVGALEQYRAALAIREKLTQVNPLDRKCRRALWSSYEAVGYTLWLHKEISVAIEANNKALALGEALLAEDPINADYRRSLVISYQSGGDIRQETDTAGALEYFRRAVALDEELLAADPANALTRKDVAYTHKRIADFLRDLKDNAQALFHFDKALEGYQKAVTEAPGSFISRFLVVTCQAGAAQMRARLGEVEPALEECRKGIALLQEITGDKGGVRLGRAQAHEYLAHAYLALAASPKTSTGETRQRTNAARDMFRQALDILEDLRSQGALGGNEDWAKEIAGEIAKCDAVLGK